jgi:hypothetical protein
MSFDHIFARGSKGRRSSSNGRRPKTNAGRRFRPALEGLEARELLASSSQLFVTQAYRDLLHREAEPGGLAFWSGLIDRGHSRADVALGIESSPETRAKAVSGLYGSLLGRPPDPLGLSSAIQFLGAGGRMEQLEAVLLGSPEYFQRGGGTTRGFLKALYRDILGRAVDPSGAATWTPLADTNVPVPGIGRALVATAVVNSPEARTRLVQSFYAAYLHRAADPGGLTFWVGALAHGASREQVIAGFLGSVEYRNRLQAPPGPGDTRAPVVALDGPPAGSTTDHNPTVTGRVTDDRSGVASLEARVDDGPFNPVAVDAAGGFQFTTALPLDGSADGSHTVELRATDRAGNRAGAAVSFVLDTQPLDNTGADPVLRWNQAALAAVSRDATVAPVAARNLALVHLAILDAVHAVEGTPAYLVALPAAPGSSAEAAISAAAHQVLSYLYPAQQAALDAERATALALVPDGAAKSDGLAVGQAVASAVIALRSQDGWNTFVDYVPGDEPGAWRPTLPMFDVALAPQWGDLKPFAIPEPEQFRPAGPPALESLAYGDAVAEVQRLGRASGSARTAEQTQIARFWADGAGTYTPPGHWNVIAAQVAKNHPSDLAGTARLFAELNLALADAGIVAWDAKYAYEFWRPVTAIREADTDGNPDTQPDADWTSLLITPPFPEYVSGHSTFSGAGARVLQQFTGSDLFGARVTLKSGSSKIEPGATPLLPVVLLWPTFSAARDEAGESRRQGGIHFPDADHNGRGLGASVGQAALAKAQTYFNGTAPQP